ncbi:MAG: ABC transporter ATP-binding protein [Thermoleophilia bacterium]|nr:ABC transporter ATP-binding protein [Thermoleophilia bacterium]
MKGPVIRVEGLSKLYRIGQAQPKYHTLRESIMEAARKPGRVLRSLAGMDGALGLDDEIVWALRDISFEVEQGEVMGVIGRNGAGKSTLLKILTRITEPTEGRAEIHGRVASLLEVGTGFHPELTGRENIFLNGAILGMRKVEIERTFDEIVEFAEVERFIETPVKHYSSGMYLRLAFAVAAHLQPEILLVDEVLAVGDAAFQRKCLGKMGEVARQGRTVLFVSHNMGAVRHLCDSAMLLVDGRIAMRASASEVIDAYMESVSGSQENGLPGHVVYDAEALGEEIEGTRVIRLELLDLDEAPMPSVRTWDDFVLRVVYSSDTEIKRGAVVVFIYNLEGVLVARMSTQPDSDYPVTFRTGRHHVDCHIESLPLAAGEYIVGASLARPHTGWIWKRKELGNLRVESRDVYESGRPPVSSYTLLALRHHWSG